MSEAGPDPKKPRPLSLSEQVDLASDQFEAALRDGQQPQIEGFLAAIPAAGRAALLRELVALEIDSQLKKGWTITFGNYYRRFPDDAPILDALQAEFNSRDSGIVVEVQVPVKVDVNAETVGLPNAPRRRIKHFELISILGEGGFGTVWHAKDLKLQRDVAIKIPRKDRIVASDMAFFLREARAAAKLHHPNIIAIHEVGEDESSAFIVSDLVHGINLKDWISTKKMSCIEAAILVGKMATAVHHAHERGIVHRDLKPANVLLDHGHEPHIADFGLAKRDAGDDSLAIESQLVGTPGYMSPEQANADHKAVDRRSDVYSLGAIFYELLTGQRVFRGELSMLLHQIQHSAPTPPRKIQPNVPRELEAICLKCLAKEREKRYATAQDLADDLDRFIGGETLRGIPTALPNRLRKWIWRNRRPTVAMILVAVIAIGLSAAVALSTGWHTVGLRPVEFTTDPPGCEITVVQIDPNTGEPDPAHIQRAPGRTPIVMGLVPGDYLVVAVLDDLRFHEVYRHVPLEGESMASGKYDHQYVSFLRTRPTGFKAWLEKLVPSTRVDGVLTFRSIQIPRPDVTLGMGFVEGANNLDRPAADGISQTTPWQIGPLFVDLHEVEKGDVEHFNTVRKRTRKYQIRNAQESIAPPSTALTYDDALGYMEAQGKRLPSAAEFHYLSTVVCPCTTSTSAKDQVALAEAPCVLSGRSQIWGLHGGVDEWTTTRPGGPFSGMRSDIPVSDFSLHRVVAHAEKSIGEAPASSTSFKIQSQVEKQNTVGARGVRSAKPRRNAEDFAAPTATSSR